MHHLIAVCLAVCLYLAAPLAGQPDSMRHPDVIALLDEHLDWLMREDPLWATGRGDLRFNDKLSDESPEAHARRLADLRARLARATRLRQDLSHIDVPIDPRDTLDLRLLIYELETSIASAAFRHEQMPVTAMNGPQVWLPQMGDRVPFTHDSHYHDFAARLEAMPTLIDQHIAQMRAGLAAGRVPPKIAVSGSVEQARAIASDMAMNNPNSTPFFKPFLSLPVQHPARMRAADAIRHGVLPAFRGLADFLEQEYIPACRDTIAASKGIDGIRAYEHALRHHTTLELTAEEIHAIGLEEVARIRREMLEVIARTNFPGKATLTGDDLLAAFIADLRTNPRFYHESAEALLAGYRDICKRMDHELPRLFSRLPRLPYGVREMPRFAAPSSPTAYYYRGSLKTGIAGAFVANTYRLDQRPKYEMIALALHEAVPGHHLQIALNDELAEEPGTHPYRALLSYTAFVEGWALYAERLGLEVGGPPNSRGFYADPYDDFGRLTYEMWRACRLVVDTGMHAFDWPRERAIQFMLDNTALSPTNIQAEVDRYIGWPGQATAYKIGELRIRELRAAAQAALEDRFDIRDFHDTLLSGGGIPIPILEERMADWVAQRLMSIESP